MTRRRQGLFGRILAKVLLASISIVFLLGAFEYICRRVLFQPVVPASDRAFFRIMSTWHPRSDFDFNAARKPVILGLSDSYGVVGSNTGSNFYDVVGDVLDKRNLDYSMVNVSVVAYETKEELNMLERYGSRYKPAIVLQGFTVANDTSGNRQQNELHMFRFIPLEVVPLEFTSPRTWVFPAFITRYYEIVRDRYRMSRERNDDQPKSFSREAYLEILKSYLPHYEPGYASSPQWHEVADTLRRTIAAARRMGSRYVLVINPDQLQVERHYQVELEREMRLDSSRYDYNLPQKLLMAFAKKEGIPCIDLLPGFRSAGSEGGLFLLNDSHWSRQGNRLAGELIADSLISQGIVQ
jgi:hypothetical protein